MNHKVSIFIIVLLLSLLCCSKKDNEKISEDGQEYQSKNILNNISYILIMNYNAIKDESFNQSTWEGMQKAKQDFDVTISYFPNNQENDYNTSFESAVKRNPKIIFSTGSNVAIIAKKFSQKFPNINFVNLDYIYENPNKNLSGVNFKSEEPSFLAGYIAGRMTRNNNIGFIGGQEGKIINRFRYGFISGAKFLNEKIEIFSIYLSNFFDKEKAFKVAQDFYLNKGVDIIFQAAGGAGVGVIEAAKQENKFVIGIDRDQHFLAPKNVLSSVIKNTGLVVYQIIEKDIKNEFEGGENLEIELKDSIIGISSTSNINIDQDLIEELDKIKDSIIQNQLIIPYDELSYNDFEKVFYEFTLL